MDGFQQLVFLQERIYGCRRQTSNQPAWHQALYHWKPSSTIVVNHSGPMNSWCLSSKPCNQCTLFQSLSWHQTSFVCNHPAQIPALLGGQPHARFWTIPTHPWAPARKSNAFLAMVQKWKRNDVTSFSVTHLSSKPTIIAPIFILHWGEQARQLQHEDS